MHLMISKETTMTSDVTTQPDHSHERDGRKRLFVSRVVELAHILGTKVVAEGVEQVEELHACRDAGCDLVQGFFVGRPSCEVADIMPVYAPVVANADRRRNWRVLQELAGIELEKPAAPAQETAVPAPPPSAPVN